MIFVIGEALIDKKNDKHFVGGGPLNVALAAARLDSPVSFVGGVSSDNYGNEILNFIIDNCILFDPIFCNRKERTMIAGVTVKDGKENYIFDYKDSAALFMDVELLEKSFKNNTDINCFFFGSVLYSDSKAASAVMSFVDKHPDIVCFFDPNVRTQAIEDASIYKENVFKACARSEIVKLSDEDLSFLGLSENMLLEKCRHHLIVTYGDKGATWYSKDFSFDKSVHIDGLSVPVVDTIGCGDCFSGALLHWLDGNGKFTSNTVRMTVDEIYQAMFFAVCVSAVNASREGCDPPRMEDMQ